MEVGEEEYDASFVACYDAFGGATLEIGVKKEGLNPLGMEDLDWYVYNVLLCAGITLEMLHKEAGIDHLYEVAQIVDDYEMDKVMKVTDINDIKFVDEEDQLGIQVKLNGMHKWKLTIVDENLATHHVGAANRARRASASAAKTSSFENLNVYEIAVGVPNDKMYCTAAIATGISISIAFQTKEVGHDTTLSAQWDQKNHFPLIHQRRIDCIFTNEFVVTTQVCVP